MSLQPTRARAHTLKHACSKTRACASRQVHLHTHFPDFKHILYTHTHAAVVYSELTGGLNGSECLLNEMGEGGWAGYRAYREMKSLSLSLLFDLIKMWTVVSHV